MARNTPLATRLQLGMEFSWSEDQVRSAEQARVFAERELGGEGEDAAADAASRFRARWRRCATFGLQALAIPAGYGGLGLNTRTAVRVFEGLGQGCRDNGLLLGLGAQAWSVAKPLELFGTEAQKREWLPRLANGEAVGAFALSETGSGSDAFRMQTRAWPDGDGFRLEGGKAFITNAPVADVFLVFASTAPEAGYFGLTAFLLERGAAGLEVGPALKKMGLETSPMAELRFNHVLLPPPAVLGELGGGSAVLQTTLEWERGCLLAPALGTIQRLLEATTAHCRARKQFGRPIIEFEAVARQLAEVRLRLELSRLLAYQFAWLKDENRAAMVEASMVKLYLSESFRRAAEVALHLHGASGYMREHEYEGCWRDAMASSLYSGTTEMQQNLIAESLLRSPAPAARRAA